MVTRTLPAVDNALCEALSAPELLRLCEGFGGGTELSRGVSTESSAMLQFFPVSSDSAVNKNLCQ